MTLPAASNPISISQINTELGRTATTANTSLTSLSTGVYVTINYASIPFPNNSTPHQMSEWHSYNHLASPSVTLTGVSLSTSTDEITFTWTYAGIPSGGYFTMDWYDTAWNTSTATQSSITSAYAMGTGVHGYDLVNSGDNGASAATMYYTINMKNSGGTTVASANSSFAFYYNNV